MTDKEKILAEIERRIALYSGLSEETVNPNRIDEDRQILSFINSLPEEPVSNPTPNERMSKERFAEACKAACSDRNYRSHYGLTETRDDYFVDGVQWADEHPIKEPVSEDLEEAVNAYIGYAPEVDESSSTYGKRQAFKAGAQWQKEQFEKNRLKHCNSIANEQAELEQGFIDKHLDKHQRMPTFLDAIEYGMNLQKEKLMAKAIDVTIAIPYQNGYGGYTQLFDSKEGLPFGDKLKVLVIKED